MEREKVDRRVRKTRLQLQLALQDLILEKGYEAITVQEILDRADVGRSTFYSHFHDKDDLLVSGFELMHAELDAAVGQGGGVAPTVSDIALGIFRHAEGNRRAFRAMMGGSSGEIVLRQARQYLEMHLRDEIEPKATSINDPAIVDAIIEFEAAALVSLVSWWLDNESTVPAERMHELFMTLTRPGLEAALGF